MAPEGASKRLLDRATILSRPEIPHPRRAVDPQVQQQHPNLALLIAVAVHCAGRWL